MRSFASTDAMVFQLLLILWTGIIRTALAAPTLQYPLMDQLPPVARVGQPFIFNIFPNTFTSSSSINYTTSQLPSWLSWNLPSLAFHGTPAASDLGEQDISLTADDGSGTIVSNFTLLVSKYAVPGIHRAFTTQIGDPSSRVFSSATALPGNTGVSIPAQWSFSLGFAADTFRLSHSEPVNGDLFLSARIRGMTGLPDWLIFSNDSMTFTGNAPSNGSYTVVVTGSDYWGYQGAQTSFVIEIGEGEGIEMSKGGNFSSIVTMARNEVNYQLDVSNVLVDGEPATKDQVAVSLDNTNFPWLSLDR